MINLNTPPHNLDAEKSVIGSVLFLNQALDDIDLKPEEFYQESHETIFGAIRTMWASGTRGIDAVNLSNKLMSLGKFEEIGGAAYIAEILESVPHAAHVKYYANIVREKAQQRGIINACREAMQKAYSGESGDVVAELESSLLALRETSCGGDIITMDTAVDALEQMEANPASIHPTGLTDIDRQIRGGLRGKQLIVVAGRPGSGKSIAGGQIAKTFSERGEPSLIVSLEMDRAEMAERFDKSVDRRTLRGLPLYLVDSAFEAGRIAGLIRLAKRKHKIQLAVVDYLQLAESSDRKASRERQVAEISRTLKRLAAELKIPIIAACQLNRSNEKEQRLPRLSDLRESGSIEQDADIVILLHQAEDGQAKAIVAKQRNGSTGVVPLTFVGERFRFENHTPYSGNL